MTIAQILGLITAHPVADIDAAFAYEASAHPDLAPALAVVRTIFDAAAGGLATSEAQAITEATALIKTNLGPVDDDPGMTA